MLNLHSGGDLVTYGQLQHVATPARTASHVPLPHFELVNMVKYALGYYGHTVEEEHHAIAGEGGVRYFGLLTLTSEYGLYRDTVGLRNSHDSTFPIGIAFGSNVFVCSNLSFLGDHVIKRKHTANSRRDLPGLVAEVIEPLKLERQAQREKFQRYVETEVSDLWADHTILELYRAGVLNIQRIPEVLNQWQKPEYPEWGNKTAWRLFNAATFALNGRVAENPSVTRRLHKVIDGVCEIVN